LSIFGKIQQILRGVYPEPLRIAQGRSQAEGERAQDDVDLRFFTPATGDASFRSVAGGKLGEDCRYFSKGRIALNSRVPLFLSNS